MKEAFKMQKYGLLAVAFLVLAFTASAQEKDIVVTGKEIPDAPFVGIKQFAVNVYVPDDAALARYGLSKTALQTDAELKLRQAGIPVVSAAPGGGNVKIMILSAPFLSETGAPIGYGFFIEVAFVRSVSIPGSRAGVNATVWRVGSTVTCSVEHVRDIRANVSDRVDELLNAYLATNPK